MTHPRGPLALGTKAETLERLAPALTTGYCLPLVRISRQTFARAPQRAALLVEELGVRPRIVRSSSRREDGAERSHAGAFLTVPDVPSGDAEALERAITAVFSSYGEPDEGDEVLVQPQLQDARLAGVLFTRELSTHAPYYVLNFTSRRGDTTSVTAGRGEDLELAVFHRSLSRARVPEELRGVLSCAQEIEGLFGRDVEIELAVDDEGRVCVFQVRAITSRPPAPPPADPVVEDWLVKAAKKVEKLSRPHPHLCGPRGVFGVMPDWNPAEMIGLRPRALALTLYKELITDGIWAYQRDRYGYRNLRSYPLLISLLGVPFIDVRVSFNSFVPKAIDDDTADRLVAHYVDQLVAAPELHDKVEFEIVNSCVFPGVRERLAGLREAGLGEGEIAGLHGALRDLTRQVIHPADGLWRADRARIDELDARYFKVLASPMSRVDKIYWLLEDAKRYGTLPFSGLARSGFIAAQMLRGLVDVGALSVDDAQRFMASLDTVANQLARDAAALRSGRTSQEAFLRRYGHLRPGTYDILSPRYDREPERYLRPPSSEPEGEPLLARAPFELSRSTEADVAAALREEGLELSAAELFAFLRGAIEGREHAKFIFTRSLSQALEEIRALGQQCELDDEALSHLNIRTVLGLYATLDAWDLRDVLLRDIERNRQAYEITRTVRLPELLLEPDEVFGFVESRTAPNFVTLKRASGPVVRLGLSEERAVEGAVVCLEAADPGFDWLFGRGVAALITRFGGANSHMAIRAAELGVPAVIGVGARRFEVWSAADALEVDCGSQQVKVLR